MVFLPALATGASVFLLFLAIQTILAGPATVDARLRQYGRVADSGALRAEDGVRSKTAVTGHIDRALKRRGMGNKLAVQLERADVHMVPSEFVMVTAVLVFGVAGVSFLLLRNPAFGLLATAMAFYAPRVWLWRKRQKRFKAFNGQLAGAIALLANSLRSGYSLPQALELLSRDARPPLSHEFSRVNREVNLGLSPADAMANVLNRVPSDDLDLFITAINIQREVGGNLAEVLDAIADTIRDRIKLLGEVRVLTAQQSYAGYVVTLLPVVLAAVMFLISRSYMEVLFTTLLGWIMLSVASMGIIAGFFAMRKIVNIRV
ncbi:MAG: type II secretion system F family protein [Chloroflexota bacterium]